MFVPAFTAGSRLMMIAPHPDDESLACSVLLQQAVRAGVAIRVVYATDGDDNPWPQRVLERKWRLNATDRRRWGRLRRTEALAALRVLGVNTSAACFLGLPDQKLTALLMCDCRPALERFVTVIADWAPTDLLVPSISDTHPDHSALAVITRLALSESSVAGRVSVWSYAVHGRSPAFFGHAQTIPQSEIETATKLRAIRCHNTQLKLSRKRFLAYAGRPERLVKIGRDDKTIPDGSIVSVSRLPHSLCMEVRLSPKAMRTSQPMLFVLGSDDAGSVRCATIRVPARSSRVQLLDSVTLNQVGVARYHGNAFSGGLRIPLSIFSPAHAIFVKVERRSWFFDEAGWLRVPTARSAQIVEPIRDVPEARPLAIR
jgi:LmbE family N-acetylglucosaminyl deacetylase